MELSINVRNMKLSTRLQNYVENKTGRLDRYMPNLADVHVDLSSQKAKNAAERQVAQITIRDERGTILRAEERSNDMFAAIDAVVDKLYRQIKRFRGKRRRRRREGGIVDAFAELDPVPVELDVEDEEEEAAIVRTKQFTMRPLPADEAIEQMELLGHDFFVFFNSEDDAINVVYKRHGGDYGLLQPDMG